VLKDVPRGTEVGIDLQAWNTGDRFLGIKLIPPGIHFLYYSAVNTGDRSTAPRLMAFFHLLGVRRWKSLRSKIYKLTYLFSIDFSLQSNV
jgi:A1 cistron-splicing factor AAR2